MRASAVGRPQASLFLSERLVERMTNTGEPGVYQTAGLEWNPRGAIAFLEAVGSALPVDIEVPGTRSYNRDTNTLSFDTKLGGKAYVDLSRGTLRFATATLPVNAELRATYTPRFLRISGANRGAGHSSPSLLFDNRLIGEFSYWARADGSPINASDPIRPGRFMFTYGRGASGEGQTARPYLRSARLGIQLPTGIHTQPNGTLTAVAVSGATGFCQFDHDKGLV